MKHLGRGDTERRNSEPDLRRGFAGVAGLGC